MAKVDEHELFASIIGKNVNKVNFGALAQNNGNGYGNYADSQQFVIYHYDYYESEEYQKLFGLTPALIEKWDSKGIDFKIYVYIRDDIITGGRVFKYVDTSTGCHFRPTGYETDATQQELRVVSRILSYITYEQ